MVRRKAETFAPVTIGPRAAFTTIPAWTPSIAAANESQLKAKE